MSTTYNTPVTVLRCVVCGGIFNLINTEPEDKEQRCAHHGADTTEYGPGAAFETTGLGRIGSEFEIEGFAVYDLHENAVEHMGHPDYPGKRVEMKRISDYEAVVIGGESISHRAGKRGVAKSTIRSNISRARRMFDH